MASPKTIACALLVTILVVAAFARPLRAGADTRDPAAVAREAGKPVIADFGLGFCKQCKQQTATLKEIEAAYGDRVVVRMVNVGKESSLVSAYGVELIPTLVFFDASGKETFRKVGPLPYVEIRDQLARLGVKEKKK